MTASVASAPGKIVICGEYAVLAGAPAICMAINRRARASVSAGSGAVHTVHTRGLIEGDWRYRRISDARIEWVEPEPPGGLDLLQQVLRATGCAACVDIVLDTGDFLDPASQSKLGLGSSAALTAALVTALCGPSGDDSDIHDQAMRAHRRFQRGKGSGVDVAASLVGGVIAYRMSDAMATRPLKWPSELHCAVLWSGTAASTSEALERFETTRRTSGMRRLCDASEVAARAWSSGTAEVLLTALKRYTQALEQFDIDHGLGIFDAGHRELAEAAADKNLLYKPCGAGGGDIGMIFAIEREALKEFVDRAVSSTFRLLDVSLDTQGAVMEC